MMATEYGLRLKKARTHAGLTQMALWKKTGIAQSTISTAEREGYGSGDTPVYAQACGVNALWLATGEGDMLAGHATADITAPSAFVTASGGSNQTLARTSVAPVAIDLDNNPDYPSVRRVNIKAQAGVSGYAVEYMHDDGPPIVFRADWYRAHNYRPEKMLAMRVAGESMVPSLYPHDIIVINTESEAPKDGIAFVVAYEGEITVKRLVRDDGLWWLASDNADQRRYPRKKCSAETQIIGEVVYRQTERI